MSDTTPQDKDSNYDTYGRSSCTECQRRKQKCNRTWPCDHCQRRKVADKCSFKPLKSVALGNDIQGIAKNLKRRQSLSESELSPGYVREQSLEPDVKTPDYQSVGYMTTSMFAKLDLDKKKEDPKFSQQFYADPKSCPQLEHALNILPPRPNMDALIENFLQSVNYHYYIVYPGAFLEEYQDWWATRSEGKQLGVQYTCLLLMICACTMQHLDVGTRRMLELDWGDTAQNLAEQYHHAGRELTAAVPAGFYHMYNVQQLLHSCYWYKAEAKFLECWHVLSTVVREAQELGYHKESRVSQLADFEREMAKRIWCIINCWDWQVSSGLLRPTIVDRTDCDVGLPAMSLETYEPSPLHYMLMQAELIDQLADRFVAPKNVSTPHDVEEYKGMIEDWMAKFPAVFAFNNPDKSKDNTLSYVSFHRYYLYTMAYLMILNPIRAYMAESMSADSPKAHIKIRREGIDYALKLLISLREWLDLISHRDGRFHFIIFALLDTSLSLCNATIHDQDKSLPRREEVSQGIDTALSMLKRLKLLSPTAKASHDILHRLAKRVPRPDGGSRSSKSSKRKKAKVRNGYGSQGGQTEQVAGLEDKDIRNDLINLLETGGRPPASNGVGPGHNHTNGYHNGHSGHNSGHNHGYNNGYGHGHGQHSSVIAPPPATYSPAFDPRAQSFTTTTDTTSSYSNDYPGNGFAASTISEGHPGLDNNIPLVPPPTDSIISPNGTVAPAPMPVYAQMPPADDLIPHMGYQTMAPQPELLVQYPAGGWNWAAPPPPPPPNAPFDYSHP